MCDYKTCLNIKCVVCRSYDLLSFEDRELYYPLLNYCLNVKPVVKDLSESIYYVIYPSRKCSKVSKKVFSKMNLPCHVFGDCKIKSFLSRNETKRLWKPQVLHAPFQAMTEGITSVVDSFLEQINTVRMAKSALCDGYDKIFSMFQRFKEKWLDIFTSLWNVSFAFSAMAPIMKVLPTLLLNLYSLFGNVKSVFVAQGMDSLLLGYLSSFLPSQFISALKMSPLLSSTRLLDDNITISGAALLLDEYLTKLFDFVSLPDFVSEFLFWFVDLTPLGKKSALSQQMLARLTHFKKYNNDIFYPEEQGKILALSEKVEQYVLSNSYKYDNNKAFKELVTNFRGLVKNVNSYLATSRQEPVCLVFEGPAGCQKSISMSKLAENLKVPVYTHTIPCKDTGKDFYDDYNNETVMVVDDIGQMGASQWSPIINMISMVKYPLPCAVAEKKNTKYFCSDLVLATTNQLRDLPLHNNDGISCPSALYRRCYILDYTQVFSTIVNGESALEGRVNFMHFDLGLKKYIMAFPPGFKDFIEKQNINLLPYCSVTDPAYHLWLYKITTALVAYKKDIHEKVNRDKESFRVKFQEEIEQYKFSMQYCVRECYNDIKHFICGDNTYYIRFLVSRFMNYYFPTASSETHTAVLAVTVTLLFTLLSSMVVKYTTEWFSKSSGDKFSHQSLFQELTSKFESSLTPPRHNGTSFIAKNSKMLVVEGVVNGISEKRYCCCLLSGKHIITVGHSVSGFDLDTKIYVTVFGDVKQEVVCYDKVPVTIGLLDLSEDFSILVLPDRLPLYFSNLKSHFSIDRVRYESDSQLVTPVGTVDVNERIKLGDEGSYVVDKITRHANNISEKTHEIYKYQGDMLCGCALVDSKSLVVGLHVAGMPSKDIGAVRVLSASLIEKIRLVLADTSNTLRFVDAQWKAPKLSNVSVNRMEVDFPAHSSVPKETKLIPSPIHSFVSVGRAPANLTSHGVGTVKEMAKKSYMPVASVDQKSLEFAEAFVSNLIPRFSPLSERQVVKGDTDLQLNAINKDSSNGFGLPGDKNEYLDYDKGVFKEKLKTSLKELESQLASGNLELKRVLSVETLKDELRNLDKVDKPRCFKVLPLTLVVKTKQLLGKMCALLHKKRWSNGIMIGCNPFRDFKVLHMIARKYGNNVFDGDYGKWDGKMLAQFQYALNRILLRKFDGTEEEKAILESILMLGVNTPTLNMNEVLVTTHSLPSGWFLTADYNSLINKMYGAYVYHQLALKQNLVPSIEHFIANVYDAVYGDDKLVFVSDAIKKWFNGPSYASVCNSIGLDFTTAVKGEWDYTTRSIEECQFLKRGFRYHTILGEITAPLDLNTVLGTLHWVRDGDDADQIFRDKVLNFQREIFLHEDKSGLKDRVEEACGKVGISVCQLSEDYLTKLYKDDLEKFSSGLLNTCF